MRLVEALTADAQGAIHWLEDSASSSPATTAATGSHAVARDRETSAPGRRPDRARDHEGTARCVRGGASGTLFANSPLTALAAQNGWRATCGEHELDAATVVLAAGGRCFKVAEERGELSTNHPNATGEVTRIALGLGAEARDLDELQYHPNGGAWPETMQGYSIPETTRAYGAVLLNADGEEFTGFPRPAGRRQPGDLRRSRGGEGRRDRGRSPGGLPRHDADRARGRRSRFRTCSAATAGGDRPAGAAGPHLPGAPLPERRPDDRHGFADHGRGLYACGEIAGGTHGATDDGQLPPRMCCIRTAGRPGAAERARRAPSPPPISSTRSRTPRRTSTSGP